MIYLELLVGRQGVELVVVEAGGDFADGGGGRGLVVENVDDGEVGGSLLSGVDPGDEGCLYDVAYVP